MKAHVVCDWHTQAVHVPPATLGHVVDDSHLRAKHDLLGEC